MSAASYVKHLAYFSYSLKVIIAVFPALTDAERERDAPLAGLHVTA